MTCTDLTTRQRLTSLGFTVHRVDEDGRLKGMQIRMGGIQIHNTPYAHVSYAIDLCDKLEQKSMHVSEMGIENG